MRRVWLRFCVLAVMPLLACSQGMGTAPNLEPNPPPALEPVVASSEAPAQPSTDPSADSNPSQLDLMVTKSMLYSAGLKHGVNPYLVMGLAWHESGWNPSAISSAGAIGIMQVMPATAAADGLALLHREVDLFDAADNIDMGTAILKNNLDRYHNDLAKSLLAYYAGAGAVTDWNKLRDDERRYVWSVYRNAIAFRDGKGPV